MKISQEVGIASMDEFGERIPRLTGCRSGFQPRIATDGLVAMGGVICRC